MATRTEEIPNITESLKSLGLTKYEALVYIALLKMAGATATEIHEISGVPRASVYPVLDKLIQKNLVSVSHTSPRRFDAMPPEEGISNLLVHIEKNARDAKKTLEKVYSHRIGEERGTQELIWSIYGQENIQLRILDLVRNAGKRIIIFSSPSIFTPSLIESLEKTGESVRVEIITDRWTGPKPANVKLLEKHLPHGHELGDKKFSGGVFIFDCQRARVVMGVAEESITGLYSESEGFVKMFITYMRFFKSWEIK